MTDADGQDAAQPENGSPVHAAADPDTKTERELTDIDHIGDDRADTLREEGYESVADVRAAGRDALYEVDGIGPTRAERIIESAEALVGQQATESNAPEDKDRDGNGNEDERPRAIVTFDGAIESGAGNPDTDTDGDVEEEGHTDAHADRDGRLRLRTLFAALFGGGLDTSPTAETSDDHHTDTDIDMDTDASLHDSLVTQIEEDAETPNVDTEPSKDGEPTEEESAVARAKVRATAVFNEVSGRVRMFVDRRVVDLRAYGVTDWTALTFECSDDAEQVRELLEEAIYIGEVPTEVSGHETEDPPGTHLSPEARVRVPREGIEQVEEAARAGKPEAKRTVTLLRRALRAYGASAASVTGGQ